MRLARLSIAALVLVVGCGRRAAAPSAPSGAANCGQNPPVVSSISSSVAAPHIGSIVQLTAAVDDLDQSAQCGGAKEVFSYRWTLTQLPAGSQAHLNDGALSNPSLRADVSGDYGVRLVVTDSTSLSNAPASFTFHASDCEGSLAAVAAVTPSSAPPYTPVVLSVSPSDGDAACGPPQSVTYAWQIRSRPAGSSAVLSSEIAPSPSFVPDVAGFYEFAVQATNDVLVTSPLAFAVLQVLPCGEVSPTVSGIDVLAGGTVGATLRVGAHQITDLNCLASGVLTYAWQLVAAPAGSRAVLDNPAAATPSFLPDLAGMYQVALTVVNSQGRRSQPAYVTLQVQPCGVASPAWPGTGGVTVSVVDPQPSIDTQVHVGALVTLTPHAIDPNVCGAIPVTLAYRWSLIARPLGSQALLTSGTDARPSFIPDLPGGYQVAVVATDSLGNASPAFYATVATSACGAQKPVVAVSPFTLAQPSFAPVPLTAVASSPDNQGDPTQPGYCPARFAKTLSYQWRVASAPAGSPPSLAGASTAQATLVPAAPGSYGVSLLVTDSSGLSAPPAIATVQVTCGSAVPAAVDSGTPAFQATQIMPNIAQIAAGGGAPTSAPLTVVSSTLKAGAVKFYTGTTVKMSANVVDANFSCGFTPATLRYKWTFTSVPTGSQPSFDNSTSPTPSFVPDVAGDYFIQLDLIDSAGKANTQVFTLPGGGGAVVSVGSCGKQTPTSLIGLQQPASPAPTANIGSVNGFAVIFDGGNSYSPDNAPVDFSQPSVPGCGLNRTLSYGWAFVSLPSGAQGTTFNDPTRVNPAFTPTTSGSYVISLAVNDGFRTSQATTVSVVTADGAVGTLDYVAPQGTSLLPAGLHHYNTFRIPAGATVYLDPANASGGVMDLVVNGDVYIGGMLNLSGSPGMTGPSGDVSWIGSGGGDTAYPLSNHGTPTPGGGCPTYNTLSRSLGGNGGLGADGVGTAGCTSPPTPALGGYGGGMGGGQSGGGGGGFAGGGGGGGNTTCGGNVAGGAGAGTYGGAGGAVAQGGQGGNGGGAPYSGAAAPNLVAGDCTTGYGGGGGGGSIGLDAAQDVSMSSSLRAGSGGGGGAGDEGRGGGGGGGAVRIRSNSSITVTGQILAQGGHGGDSGGDPTCCQGGSGGGGSGGAIWLGAPVVYTTGTVSATGGRAGLGQSSRGVAPPGGAGGLGRIRISSPKLTNFGTLQPPLPPNGANGPGYTYVTSTYP
jgi:hypothetical protein